MLAESAIISGMVCGRQSLTAGSTSSKNKTISVRVGRRKHEPHAVYQLLILHVKQNMNEATS
jgi:hypothetical protein